MMRVIVSRHFKTLNNVRHRIIGWHDSPPAKDWQDDLIHNAKIMRDSGMRFDRIIASALKRAYETARWYAARIEMHGSGEVLCAPEMNEVNYGDLSLLSKRWVAEHCVQYKTDPDYIFPGGESFQQMRSRSVDFLRSLECDSLGQTLLLVVHAGVIRGLITHFLDLPYAPNLRRKISHRYLGDFRIKDGQCIQYQEFGEPSGFVLEGVLGAHALPCGELDEGGRVDLLERPFVSEFTAHS